MDGVVVVFVFVVGVLGLGNVRASFSGRENREIDRTEKWGEVRVCEECEQRLQLDRWSSCCTEPESIALAIRHR